MTFLQVMETLQLTVGTEKGKGNTHMKSPGSLGRAWLEQLNDCVIIQMLTPSSSSLKCTANLHGPCRTAPNGVW